MSLVEQEDEEPELSNYESYKWYKRFWWALFICIPLIYLLLTLLYP